MKIFILKPSSLGDVIQALPVLRLLKLWRPDAQIHWWLDKNLLPLLEGDPDLAGIIPFDRKGWTAPSYWQNLWTTWRGLRRQRFDWVIDLQSLARSGALAWLANGGVLAGLDDAREGARGYYDITVSRPSYHTHAVDWYLGVLRALQVPTDRPFVWLPPRPAVAQAVRAKWPVMTGGRWVALVPGARWDNKRWPAEFFAAVVAQAVRERNDWHFAVIGGKEDRELGQTIAAAGPGRCLNLAGQTTLPEMVEWLRLADAVVSNDTGPMHIAAALRKPLVALFGPTEPRRTGPYGQPGSVLQTGLECVPCMKGECHYFQPLACLRGISPETVLARLRAALTPTAMPASRSRIG